MQDKFAAMRKKKPRGILPLDAEDRTLRVNVLVPWKWKQEILEWSNANSVPMSVFLREAVTRALDDDAFCDRMISEHSEAWKRGGTPSPGMPPNG